MQAVLLVSNIVLIYGGSFVTGQCGIGEVRLNSGSDFGRVEVCINRTWGTLCDDFWDNDDASVVCRQLGFSPFGAIGTTGSYTEGSLPMHIIDLNCTGSELSVLDCPHNGLTAVHTCDHRQDASIRCQAVGASYSNCSDGDVRLTGSLTDYQGRVEICINNLWGTICYSSSRYNSWDINDARIVCRNLGHQELGITVYQTAYSLFGQGSGPIFLTNVHCSGSEMSLLECPRTVFVGTACTHSRDVGLRCQPRCINGSVRILTSSESLSSTYYGRVEVCINDTWGTVCSDFWENKDASVVCRQLGYSEYGAVASRGLYTETVWPVHIIDLNCTGVERMILECSHNGLFDEYNCPSRNDASLGCQSMQITYANCSDGDVRLVDGSVDYEGRVEVCINQVWGTVCSTTYRYNYPNWDLIDAKVVCRQLGHQELGATVYTSSSTFGAGSDPVFLSDLYCVGSEASLLECRNTNFVQLGSNRYCTHSRDVGLRCEPLCSDGAVRLASSAQSVDSVIGRVEVCVNGTWGTLCSDFWENIDASVVCKQLGYSEYGAVAGRGLYTETVWPFHIIDLNCTGWERTVWECPHNGIFNEYSCPFTNDASVRCQAGNIISANCSDGDVRLVDGSVYYEGRVEICINRVWGTVCSTTYRYNYPNWDLNDAKVVCRQLGHQELGATVYTSSSTFGAGSDPVFLSDLYCVGSEANLLECRNSNFIQLGSNRYCTHSRDVGLKCEPLCSSGAIRVVSSTNDVNSSTGRIEVCVNSTWGTICSDFWENEDASIVCKQVGYSEHGAIAGKGSFLESVWPFHIIDLNCTGGERTIWECPHNNLQSFYSCASRSDASVLCQVAVGVAPSNCSDGDVRLVDGSVDYEGRVEICINRLWGTVCSTTYRYNYPNWDLNDAKVVCRQLGHQELGAVVYTTSSTFGPGNGPVFLSNIQCIGSEKDLLECRNTLFVGSYCTHGRDVGVRCEAKCASGTIRLVSESNSYFRSYGRVELCINETWTTICDEHWDDTDASVVCHQLGYSRYGATASFNSFIDNIWPMAVTNISCTGSEETLLQCAFSTEPISACNQRSDASAVCQSILTMSSNCTSGEIRLSGELTAESGRLEMCINNAWGSVCNNNWDVRDVRVACRELGFQQFYGFTVSTSSSNYAGIGSGPIFRYQTECSGSESSFSQCNSVKYPTAATSCNHYDDVTLQCIIPCKNGDVRLYGSSVERAGVVHVCVNGTWGKVCGGEHNPGFASVVCSQLGYSPYGAVAARGLWSDNYYIYHMYHPECYGNESNILECPYGKQDTVPNSCSQISVLYYYRYYYYSNSDATSVICLPDEIESTNCTDGDIRLVGKSMIPHRGRLEICRGQVWGTVCSSRGFSTVDANTVCQSLGYQSYGSITFSTPTSKYNPPLFADFDCSSTSFDLSHCNNPSGVKSSVQSCGPSVIGIQCVPLCEDREVRLVGGYGYGRVEVCASGLWGTLCSDEYWDYTDAGVICKQLGFSNYGALALSNWYTEREKIGLFHSVECNGTEESIFDCRTNEGAGGCGTYQDASVICHVTTFDYNDCTTGDVRLVDGPSPNKGRVEVCINHAWASICSTSFDREEANVVCGQLGYIRNGATIRGGGYYGQSYGPIMRYFWCGGTENTLFECSRRYLTHSLSCNHDQDVGLDCELPCVNGSVRLVGSQWNYQGRVEVCVNNTWGTICTNFWDTNDTAVVCRQLGFSSSDSRIYNGYGERYWPLHIIDINCTGEESTIWDCPHNAVINSNCRSYYQDAAVTCAVDIPTCTLEEEGDLRLLDGISMYEGRVEVCTNREWGTICNRYWNNQEAMVVCRQLGFHTDGAIVTTRYRYGSGIIHFNAFGCIGDEVNILSCPHSHPAYYCSHSTDAGVICRGPCSNGDVQLIGDSRYNYFGRIEVCINGSWGKVCSDMWENNDASVVCRQLGFSPHGAIARLGGYQQSALKYHMLSANCLGDEIGILNCSYTLMQPQNMCSSSAGVICQESVPGSASVSSNCTNYDIRFEPDGTPDQNKGKLQMCFGGFWGAICTYNGLSGRSAEVVCDQLGFQRRGSTTYTVGFDLHSDLLTIRQISCSGNEPNVSQCSVQFYTQLASCSQRSVTALQCIPKCRNGDVRIAGSSFTRLGRVEVCINSTWGTICDNYWDNNDASVVCKQLGHSPYGAIAIHNSFSETTWPVYIYDLNCTGLESTFLNCPHNALNPNLCNHRQDAAVSCLPIKTNSSNCTNGDLRVDNMESDKASGRLEMCDNGVWFSVLRSNSWISYYSQRTRSFACQSLGYESIGATVYPIYYLDQSFRYLYPLDFSCPSTITSFLRDCARNYHSSEYQSSTLYEVGIRCTSRTTECDHGQIQLVGSNYKQIGRVEVCINGTWGTICDDYWNNTDASVVCRHLGYSPHGAIALSGLYTERNRPTLIHDLNCTGTEASLFNCPFNALINYPCYRYDDAAIVCQDDAPVVSDCTDGDIRLTGAPTSQEGTIEICISNVWGGICQYSWGSTDANVACSQLGYQPVGATAIHSSFFGKHANTFHMTNVGCSGTEKRLIDCPHSKLAVTACGDGQYAGVRCLEACEEGSVRVRGLRNSRFGGRVEVCIELTWTTVCDSTWDNLDASVICFQLGFSRYGAISTFGLYTEGQLLFGITDIHCNGTEDNFTTCTHNEANLHNCQPHDDAGVICQESLTPQSQCTDGDVRLVGGYGNYEGRVEVCINQAWGTVCDNNWDNNDANVVCGQLGFLQRGSIARRGAHFGMASGPILLADLFCSGLEDSLLDCNRNTFGTLNCAHFEDAGVTCEIPCTDGEIRLRGTSVTRIGRVEVCINGTWGTVCDNMWDNTDASVVCRQLGFSPYGSVALFRRFSDSVWPTLINDIKCTGSEESIWQCPHVVHQDSLCGDSSVVCQDAAILFSNCSDGEVRLVGGNSENEGRVEVCLGNTWGTVCDDGWNYFDANIVCRQLGYQPFGAVAYSRAHFGQGSGPILLNNVQCAGTEASLIECYWSAHNIHTCLHSEDAGVMCQGRCIQGSIRTSGTNSDRYGAIEVCVNGTWGAVCNDFWDDLDARVFCRQLGYSPYGALSSNDFSSSPLQINLMNVSCLGNEESLLHCEKTFVPPLQRTFCSSKAGVLCQISSTFANCGNGDVRLAGGSQDYQGRVEVCINNAWGTVCDMNWDLTEGNMICQQLGFQPFGATPLRIAPFGRGKFPIILGGLSCSGQERSLLECNRNDNSISNCHINQVASLQCEDLNSEGNAIHMISGKPKDSSEAFKDRQEREMAADIDRFTSNLGVILEARIYDEGKLKLSRLDDHMILFLASLPEEEYQILLEIFQKFEDCDLKDQTLSRTQRIKTSKLDCKGTYFKPLRGVEERTRKVFLEKLRDGDMSFAELIKASEHAKNTKKVQASFMKLLNIDSWEEARQIYPQHTTEENLAPFLPMTFKPSVPASFVAFCQQAKQASLIQQAPTASESTEGNHCIQVKDSVASVLKFDVLAVETSAIIAAIPTQFTGVHLTIVDPPKGWSSADVLTVCRLVRSINAACGLQYFNMAIISEDMALLQLLNKDFKTQLVYCQDLSVAKNESSQLSPSIIMVIICHWSSSGEQIICFPQQTKFKGNLLTIEEGFGKASGIGHDRATPKPVLYEALIHLLSTRGQWILDPIGGIELCGDGDVRISGGPTALIGRVEVCANRTWGTVCDDAWSDRHASVVCHQLGHSLNGAISGTGGFPIVGRPSYMSGVACNGNETTLFQCTHSIETLTECPDNSIAGVVCQASSVVVSNCNHGDIRLTGSRKKTEGNVEVCIHGVWGTVCDDGWDALDANVICGQLGFYPFGAEPRYGAFYGEAVGPMIVADLSCSGRESDVLSCERNVFGITHCQEYEAAGVKCLGSFPITLSKRAGSLLGGDSIIVSRLSLREDDEVICVFDQTEVEGIYINETQALCISPPAKEESVVNFKTTVRRGNVNITGGALYQYISPENEDDVVGIEIEQRLIWNSGETANITWRPSSLIMNELINNVDVKVDASLLVYNEETEELEQTMILATDLPNIGFAQVQLPTSPKFSTSQYNVHTAILQLSVNTSTTIMPVNKRAAHQSRLRRLLQWAKKFTKARVVSTIKSSIARRLLCEGWVAATPRFPRRSIPPCPCTTNDAAGDDRYVKEKYDNKYVDAAAGLLRRYVLHKGSNTCYRQANVRDFGPGQQCCYKDDGSIITGNNGGTADLIAPTNWKTTALHFLVDVYPWILCCTGLFKDCSRYTSRRPVDDCSEWPERPPPARMFGDPHIVTLDGYPYTFNGKGEFILSETLEGSFILQGRMTEPPLPSDSKEVNSTSRGTSFVSLAIKEDDSPTVQLEILDNELVVLVDGERIDFSAIQEQRFSNITISDVGNSTYSVRFGSGTSLIASKVNNILTNILVTLPEHYVTRGLLGQYNGDIGDDLLPRNSSTPLPANVNAEDIHYNFGITWIVNNPRQSIFTYGPNGDWETYFHPEYNPAFAPNFSDPTLEEQAHDICGDDQLCLFDIAATGNVDIGSSTMDSVQQQELLQTQFVQRVCNPPCVNGACIRNNTCSCSDGYVGSSCEIEVTEECDVDLCENGAVCKQLAGDYICECLPEFTGALCENKVDIPSAGEPTNLAIIVGSVVGGLLFVVFMVTVVVCLTCYMIHRNKKIDDQLKERRFMEMKVIPDTALDKDQQ